MDEEKKIYLGPAPDTDELVEYIKVLSGEVSKGLPSFLKKNVDKNDIL